MDKSFRSRLRSGEKLLGTMVTLNTSASAEILADAGFDWLFIDGEHGPYDTADIQAILQAVGQRAACIVRVPSSDEMPIKRVLDLGADGIIAPQVNSAKHASRIVEYSRYAPEGSRGVGLGRAHGYGMHFNEYLETANDRVAVIVQAEHTEAVENIESIVEVEGIDAVLIGPYDLAASLGRMGQVDHPDVLQAIDRVTDVCLKAGVRLGYFGVNSDAVRPYIDRGYTLIVAGVDTLFLGGGAKRVLSDLR